MSKDQYSVAQVWLHWIIAALILFQYLSGDPVSHFVHDMHDGSAQWGSQGLGANYHMFMGIIVLALASARLAIRLTIGAPPHVPGGPEWTHKLANWVQIGLYVFIFATPIFGMLGAITQSEFWLDGHLVCKTVLMILVILHICGALYQIFVNKQGSFKRMLHFSDK